MLTPRPVPALTNIAQLHRATDPARSAIWPIRLEAVVCWMDPEAGLVALQDESGGALFNADLPGRAFRVGDRMLVEGACIVGGARFCLGRSMLVDNDGLHSMAEKSGTVFLGAGKHAIDVRWFDKEGEYGLEVSYQGPELPRQRIPDSALYHVVDNLAGGTTNWDRGLRYQAYEGVWDRLPDFTQLQAVSRGTATNFDLGLKSRTNHVGLVFMGYVEAPRAGLYTFFINSDDGSQLSLDVCALRWAVIATNALPAPRPISLGQPVSEGNCRWSEVEGKVTFAGKTAKGVLVELSAGAGHIALELPDTPGISPPLLLHSQIRAAGFCESTHTFQGQELPGRLLVPGPGYVRILAAAPKCWTSYPVTSIAELRSAADRPGPTIVRLRGKTTFLAPPCRLGLEDGTGDITVELAQRLETPPEGTIEVVGQVQGGGTNALLHSGLCRNVDDIGEERAAVPLLDSVEQVHALKREDAKAEYPVRVRGVVTFAESGTNGVLQDPTRGVYVFGLVSEDSSAFQAGDYVELEGVSGPGAFAPVIVCQHARRLGRGSLPDPACPTWDQLMSGSMDCQYVEIEGIVTAVQNNFLTLLLREGLLQVEIADLSPSVLASYANTHVHIRGCLIAQWDAESHQVKIGAVRIKVPIVTLDEPAPPDPFATPSKHIDELLQFDAAAGAFQRVRVTGQILHARQGEYYLTDGTNGLRFMARDATNLSVGDQVEVVGFPQLGGLSPVLREAMARRTGKAPLPPVRSLGPDNLLSGSNDAVLVEVESRLMGLRSNQKDQVLELQSGPRHFLARLELSEGLLPHLPVGSRLRVTGVYAGRGGNRAAGNEIDSFELLLNSPSDIAILQRPSWWTTQHSVAVVGALIAVLLLASGWIAGLRRQVEQRTRALKAEIEERKLIEVRIEEKARLLAAEIETRKRVEEEVDRIHKELLATSRQAGMAEVATSVLHNVGNVLNSVNVSANLISDKVKDSSSAGLSRVVGLLDDHSSDLGEFLTRDPKGRQVPLYLKQLTRFLGEEKTMLLGETQSLTQHVEHIKDIVAMQQNYARLAGVTESVNPTDLVEDALRMHTGGLARHEVRVRREYACDIPAIIVEKQKVLQVLVNLVHNAKYACDASSFPDRLLTVSVAWSDGWVRISVADNGIGIPPENLTRIFAFGFTTRKNGHGFGLHSGALAAKELGGTLSAHSDGPGKGATFCLELPLRPPSAS